MVGAESAGCRDSKRDRRRHDQTAVVVDVFSDEVHPAWGEEGPNLDWHLDRRGVRIPRQGTRARS